MNKTLLLVIATAGLTSASCAPLVSGVMNAGTSSEDVFSKTADYFGVPASDLTITDIDKGTLRTTYKTKHKGTLYNCSIYYGEVNCAEPGSGLAPGR